MSAISVEARLDRLPVTRLHRKVFNLVAVGMFFEGFDIYIAASVLAATYKAGFSTLTQNGLFISMTFVGMTTKVIEATGVMACGSHDKGREPTARLT